MLALQCLLLVAMLVEMLWAGDNISLWKEMYSYFVFMKRHSYMELICWHELIGISV